MAARMMKSKCRIRSNVFWGFSFLEIIAVCMITRIVTSDAQKIPQGFLSIDCGSNSATYSDSETGLTWKNDGRYALTGMNGNISRAYSIESNLSNHEALRSLRYFPESRPKHCYDLPMPEESTPFLIRAMFLYGGSSQLQPPIEFSAYIDSSLWFTLNYTSDNATAPPDIREGIFYLPNRTIAHFCLVPRRGVPFISSLETRPLDSKGLMYSLADSSRKALFFTTLLRWSAAIPAYAPNIRYPVDEYDRLWTYSTPEGGFDGDSNASSSLPSNFKTNASVNYVPSKVMREAWSTPYGSSIVFLLNLPNYTAATASDTSSRYVYMNLYFDGSDAYTLQNLTIHWNEENSFFHVKPGDIAIKVYEHQPLEGSFIDLTLESTSDPSLNAMEVYEETIFSLSITDNDHVSMIEMLKKNFNLMDWQGDPCTPVPYSWVTCSGSLYYNLNTLQLDSVKLSNVTNTSRLREIMLKSFVNFPTLSVIYSDVDDVTLQSIMNIDYHEFFYLDFSYNKITFIPPSANNPISLNLSHNAISGDLSSFMSTYDSLNYLNLSHNKLTSAPRNAGTNLTAMFVVDLSHNLLTSEASLETFVRTNWGPLQHIDFSHNNLTGTFNSDLYISSLPSLKLLNFDHNSITGTLNLTAWYSTLDAVVKVNASNISSIERLFSLVNNTIEDIYPPAEDFRTLIETLIHTPGFNESGFLLGGNPYCEEAKLLTQRYLCRHSVSDLISEYPKRANNSLKLIYTIVPGALALIFICFSIALSWKLWRQVRTLQAIQKTLSEREVQPRMYLYRDLKLATKNFHKENELGSGGFGAVYKGVLANETTVAVKKLFNSQQKQVLHEFLNEVVLITGIKHKNLAQLKGCCITSKKRFLVYEFAEKGNLADALWGREGGEVLEWEKRFNICIGIARGLSYLHDELQPRIIHRDIKAANILLDGNWVPKIADFGLARPFLEEDAEAYFTHVAGTRGYLAPEYYQGQFTEKVDVYSFGILLLEIVSGRKCIDPTLPEERLYVKTWAEKLYHGGELLEFLDPKLKENGAYNEIEVIRVINVALICVQIDPKFRATMFQATTMLVENVDVSFHLQQAMSHDLRSGFDITSTSMSSFSDTGASASRLTSLRVDTKNSDTGSSTSRLSSLRIDTKKWFKKSTVGESEDTSEVEIESPLLVNSSRNYDEGKTTKSLELTQK